MTIQREEYTRAWLSGFMAGASCDHLDFDKAAENIPAEMIDAREIKRVKKMIETLERKIVKQKAYNGEEDK